VARHDTRWARELVTPESRDMEIPKKGQGNIDEFFWYVGNEDQDGGVEVRVLMNTQDEQRMLYTWMVERDGAWFVDLASTLERSGYAVEAASQ
jgi:hypothetical protein